MTAVSDAMVVGCGSIGTCHARNLQTLGVDVVGYDADPTRRQSFADELGAKTVPNMETALDDDPGVTVVAVPNSAHVEVAREAARAGSHLFVEKPLSHTEDGIRRLVETADEQNLTTMVGCNMRFHPCLERFHELVGADAVGDPVTIRIEAGSYLPGWHPEEDYRDSYSARANLGGGAILDFIHEIDYARWLFGEIASVTAVTRPGTTLDIETEEAATLSVVFESGAIGQMLLDYVQRPYRRSCRLVGSEGTIEWNWTDGTVERYDPDTAAWQTEFALDGWETNDMYVTEMEHFLEAVATGEETTCPLREGWQDLRVALAARRAASEGVCQMLDGLPP